MILEPTQKNIHDCARLLAEGRLVGMPTETVYGLAGLAESPWSVSEIFLQKGRPSYNPLICHLSTPKDFAKIAHILNHFIPFIQRYWSKSVTFVLPLKENHKLAPQILAGGTTIALRIPAHPVARQLLEVIGRPIAAPSANKSNRISPTSASDVASAFPDIPVLDGGNCSLGLESSVVDLTGHYPVVLRPGNTFPIKAPLLPDGTSITLKAASSLSQQDQSKKALKSPGQLSKHYAPQRPVYLDQKKPETGQAYITFAMGPQTDLSRGIYNISPDGDLKIAAQNLYRGLRLLDRAPFTSIAIAPLPRSGLGQAIYDRLARAAHTA